MLKDHRTDGEDLFSEKQPDSASAQFKLELILSADITQECFVNAIAHRCYKTNSDVRVFRLTDGVEFSHPGALLSTVSVVYLYSDVSDEGVQFTRNVLIARTLRQSGLMREMGEGLRRIKAIAKQKNILRDIYNHMANLPASEKTRLAEVINAGISKVLSQLENLSVEDVKKHFPNTDETSLAMARENGWRG